MYIDALLHNSYDSKHLLREKILTAPLCFTLGLIATVVELNARNQYVIDLTQSNPITKEERNIAVELVAAKIVRPTSRYSSIAL